MGLAQVVADNTPEQRLWNDALSTASRFELLKQRAHDLSVGYRDHVESLIRAGVADGSFVCANPRISAWRVILILDGLVPMVHVLGLIAPLEIPSIVGPVVENELGMEAGSFTELGVLVAPRGAGPQCYPSRRVRHRDRSASSTAGSRSGNTSPVISRCRIRSR